MKEFIINPNTRIINPVDKNQALGVYADGGVDGASFTMTGDVVRKLTAFNARVNYVNMNDAVGVKTYAIDDVEINGDTLTFTWILSKSTTVTVGPIMFSICFMDNTGKEWNTTVYRDNILEGIEPELTGEEQGKFESYYEMLVKEFNAFVETKKEEISNTPGGGGTGGTGLSSAQIANINSIPALKADLTQLEEDIKNLPTSGGVSKNMADTLYALLEKCAYISSDVATEFVAFKNAWGIDGEINPPTPEEPDEPVAPTTPTLTGITVTWTVDSADVGTNPSTLISSVKANYSDGTSQNVTGYTVSPSALVEGANTVTVTYQGKTAAKTITGIAEATGDWSDWESGVPYEVDIVENEYFEKGVPTKYNTWNRTDYLPCRGASRIDFKCEAALGTYNFFFDENKNMIEKGYLIQYSADTQSLDVPSGACYVGFSGTTIAMSTLSSITPYA